MKKKNLKNKKKIVKEKERRFLHFFLPEEIKKSIWGVILFLAAIIVILSFFNRAGTAGEILIRVLPFLIGKAVFLIPLVLVLGGMVFLTTEYRKFLCPLIFGQVILILGISGMLGSVGPDLKRGGEIGYFISSPFLKLFGGVVTEIIFGAIMVISGFLFWYLLRKPFFVPEKLETKKEESPFFIKKIFEPKFKVKEVPGSPQLQFTPPSLQPQEIKDRFSSSRSQSLVRSLGLKTSLIEDRDKKSSYQFPPPDLLEKDRGGVLAGDIKLNSAIIKRTLQNFDIGVEISEVNIGPTVTQYALKPAEGVKLSKITTLTNDISLALASHPIRIEAPIPGRPLVGIEVPNKSRALVRLRELVEHPNFQNSASSLIFCLGQDVSGNPCFADLARMPHLLVAGATGTGKTCAADTLMFTEKGMLTFEELCSLPLNSEIDFKVKLVTRDGIETTGKNYNNGICQFYKLSTSRGYQIEATAEHPLWVMNEDGSQGWKATSLIKKGDFVAISRGPVLFGNKINLSNFKPSKIKAHHRKISFPSKMTSLLAQFLGLLTADGGLSIERKGIHRVTYTQVNSHLIRLYKKSLKELFGITQFIEKRAGSNPKNKAKEIEVNSKHLKEFLAYLGMDSSKSPQKEIPRAIRESSKEIVAAYLRTLFDNDGYVGKDSIELCISSKKLAAQVHLMLLNFGIVSSLSIKKVKKYAQNEYYRLPIFGDEARKFVQKIGFIRKEKYNKVKEFLKLSPNPNLDLIPHISSLLKRMGQKYLNRFALITNRGWRYQSGILVPKYAFSSLRSYNSGFRVPGYQSLEKILEFYQPISQEPEYQELERISKRNFYWDKIEKIDRTSGIGYDFYVPGSDSFVGNGFVNHNTICLNTIILSLLYENGPENLKLILVDPKRVEFPVYNDLPHLLCPVIFDSQKTINALKWLIGEMERRFEILSQAKAKDLAHYNEIVIRTQNLTQNLSQVKDAELNPIPYIILIIDELADLMAARGREMEAGIVRLAQMARAVGIHLILATQRPSVEVITGLIKANITSRITFQVASQVDSRTVLDMAGAEKLLGLGDMLFVSAEIVKPRRIQGVYVSEKEIKKVVNFITFNSTQLEEKEDISGEIEASASKPLNGVLASNQNFGAGLTDEDPLYKEAKQVVIEARKASASLLQRRLRIGYARAARLIDTLEERGVVGPGEGAKPREVYIDNIDNED